MAAKMTEKEAAAKYMALKDKERRYWAKQQILLNKAKAQGITVTEAEIDAHLKNK